MQAVGLNFMACAFGTTGAICPPLMNVIARNTVELSDITFKAAKDGVSYAHIYGINI
jgi:hypothetical protein